MTNEEKLKKYDEDIAREQDKQKRAQDREKLLKRKRAKLVRDQRTHRLCVRGGMLESFLKRPGCIDPGDLEDGQLKALLSFVFALPSVQKRLDKLLPHDELADEETETEFADLTT